MKRINIKSPTRLCEYANKVVTSWKLTYIGQGTQNGIYYYTLTDKEDNNIKIGVEIHNETQQLYNPESFQLLDNEYVKIHCKDLNVPQKRGVTKFLRVDEFKEVRRVFNTLHDAGRQLLQ
jgi:hypothetical protein